MRYLLLLFLPILVFAYTNEGEITPNDNCGAPPRYRSCGRCHFGGPSGADAWFENMPEYYSPGVLYHMELHMSHPSLNRWGFQMVAKNSSNSVVGEMISFDDNTFVTSGGYMNQSYEGCFTGETGEVVWVFRWRAPDHDVGRITFYAGLAACDNHDDEPGDRCIDISQSLEYREAVEEHKPVGDISRASDVILYDIDGKFRARGHIRNIQRNLGNGIYIARDAESGETYGKICIVN